MLFVGSDVKPANSGTISRHPGVGCISAHQPRLPRRWIGSKVSAYITCREIQGAEAGDLQVCEILAHAPPFLEDLFGWRPHVGHFRIEAKVFVDACGQVQKRLRHWPPGRKRLERIGGKLRPYPDARRLKSKLVGFEARWAAIVGNRFGCFFPRERQLRPRRRIPLHYHFASRLYHQFLVRFPNGEEAEKVAKKVHTLGARRRARLDTQLAPSTTGGAAKRAASGTPRGFRPRRDICICTWSGERFYRSLS